MDIETEIRPLFTDFEWDVKGILHKDGSLSDIPATSNPVTAIIEELAKQEIYASGYKFETPEHTRQYPDVTFHDNGERLALDIKTAQKSSGSLDGGITLGTSQSYFRSPDEDSPWIKYPYNSYDEHWVLAFLYEWDEDAPSENMVTSIEVLLNEKWKMASRSHGSGTTSNIGSSQVISKLKGQSPSFSSEHEFEQYWRKK